MQRNAGARESRLTNGNRDSNGDGKRLDVGGGVYEAGSKAESRATRMKGRKREREW